MARREIAVIQYASPGLIPAGLRKCAILLGSGLPNGVDLSIRPIFVGETAPANLATWGAVFYKPGDTIPPDLLLVAPVPTVGPFSAANTPSAGAELLTDPGLEANYTAGKCDTLGLGGGPTLAQSADVHGGTKAQEFIATGAGDFLRWTPPTIAIGTWCRVSIWAKRTAGATGAVLVGADELAVAASRVAVTSATYAEYVVVYRATSANNLTLDAAIQSGAAGYDTIIADDGSIKALTLSSLLDLRVDTTPGGVFDGAVTVAAGLQGGIAATDGADPSNGWFAYHDGTNAKLDKLVGGTWTSVISAAATYSAGATIRVVRNGNNFALYYNGAQVGSTSAINDLPSLTHFGAFRTDSSVTVSGVQHYA